MNTDWQISGELPQVPSSDLPMRGLERLAISQRLDLQADYLQVTSQVKNLGLTKSFRLLGTLDFGVNSERETDSQTRTGPSFAIELPIFNQGQARIARGEAALRQAQDKFEALAIDVRSDLNKKTAWHAKYRLTPIPAPGSVAEIADRVRTVLPIYRCSPTRRSGCLAHRKTRFPRLQPQSRALVSRSFRLRCLMGSRPQHRSQDCVSGKLTVSRPSGPG
jgi:Outer membrane efflux protein